MLNALRSSSAIAAVALLATACTVHQTETPAISGPSELGTSITVTATPDSLTQDGASQASIAVVARDASGKPLASFPIRLDMYIGGVQQDFGQLSARSLVTLSDGRATAVYTAPAPPPANAPSSGSTVSIAATPTGTNHQNASTTMVDIRLMPAGVILPPSATPIPDFTWVPSTPTANVAASFDASASTPGRGASAIISYSWSFGDGGTGSGRLVTHAFASQNSFNVTLTVTNDLGLSASRTQAVTVGAAALPTASFTFSPAAPVLNETVFFNGSASTPGAGHTSITSYRWIFGDGGTGSGQTASHVYTATGQYNVQLTVTDEAGQSATSPALTVNVTTAGLPTAVFTASPVQPGVGEVVSFNGANSRPGAGHTSIVKYQWVFGDGETGGGGADVLISHIYTRAGSYNATLTVTDNAGAIATSGATLIQVGQAPAPVAAFTSSPTAPSVGDPVVFDASTTTTAQGQTIREYAWNFGDDTPVTRTASPIVSHAYGRAGTFIVNLVVTDSAGRTGSKSNTVPVGTGASCIAAPGVPCAAFSFAPVNPTAGAPISFDGSTSLPATNAVAIIQWSWTMGDNTGTTTVFGNPFSHTFTTPGTYTVSLQVMDNLGLKASASKTIIVK